MGILESTSAGFSGPPIATGKVSVGAIGMLFVNGIPRKPSEAKSSKLGGLNFLYYFSKEYIFKSFLYFIGNVSTQKEELVAPTPPKIPLSSVKPINFVSNQLSKQPTNSSSIIQAKPTLSKTQNNFPKSSYLNKFVLVL